MAEEKKPEKRRPSKIKKEIEIGKEYETRKAARPKEKGNHPGPHKK